MRASIPRAWSVVPVAIVLAASATARGPDRPLASLGPEPRLADVPPPTDGSLVADLAWRGTLDGVPIGTMRLRVRRLEDGGFLTVQQGELRFVRFGAVIRTWWSLVEDEDEGHRLRRRRFTEGAWDEARRADDPVDRRGREVAWSGDELLVRRIEAGGRVTEERLASSGPPLGPEGARRVLASRLAAGAKRVEIARVIRLESWRRQSVSFERVGEVELQALGRAIDGVRLASRTSAAATVECTVDRQGFLLEESVPLAVGELRWSLVHPAEADAVVAGEPPELDPACVRPAGAERLPDDPRRVDRAVWRILAPPGAPGATTVGAQRGRFDRRGDDVRSESVVEVLAGSAGSARDAEGDAADLESSRFVDHQHPAVRRFAQEVLREAGAEHASAVDRAMLLRDAVRARLERGGHGVLFAPASVALTAGRGDCSEHAVLLAACLRSVGIPSRVAIGLVVPEPADAAGEIAMPWHMWTLARTERGWLDLDAVFDAPGRCGTDAARVTLLETPLADGTAARDLQSLLLLVGGVELELLEADADGPSAPGERTP